MLRRKLAENLVSAANAIERKSLLAKNKDQADVKLAWHLKELCYESWTNEPTIAQKTANALKVLASFNRNEEIKALAFWINGISHLTKGNLEQTVKELDRSAEIFNKIKKEHESAHTQVAKLIPLALLGKYPEAIECGKASLEVFEKFGDELSAGKVEKNLGNIIARQDGILKAEKYYLSAMKRFSKIKNLEELTMCEVNLADNFADLNNFRQAEEYYDQALRSATKAKMNFVIAEIEASLGNLALFRGSYSKALRHLEIARQKFEDLKIPHRSVIAELEIADIYFELNLADEAYNIYGSITEKLKKLKMQGEEARARANFGKVAVSKNDIAVARKELKRSAKLYVLENNSSGAADVKLSQANLEFLLGSFKNSLKIINEADELLEQSQNVRLKLQVNFLHAEILRSLEKFEESESILNETYKNSIKHEQLNLAQICLNSLGNLSLQKDDISEAEKYFKNSVKMIESLRSPLPAEEFRIAFLADKLAPFENLAAIYLSQKQLEKAFYYVEQARSRTLSENLQTIENNEFEETSSNTKLTKVLKDLREELNWFYSLLNRSEESEIETLQSEIKEREKKIADVMRQIESTRILNADVTKTSKQSERNSLKNLQKQIDKQKVLIEFVKFEGIFSAFVITDKGIEYIPDLATEDEIIYLLEGLQFQFGALRYGAKILDKFVNELKKRADSYLHKLYEKLLAPFEEFTKHRDLIVIPVSSLHYVPFHALFDGEKYVVENKEVVFSPSATIWKTLNEKPLMKPQNALLMGFADEHIPLVNDEVKEVKKLFKHTKSFVGKNASFANYTKYAKDFDILHLACHGQFRPDNPLFSSLHLADGFVTVRDICSQKLNAELVTLSACETGLNKIFAGDEILGLTRGFLTAGVSSLILSLWTVNDAATTDLMKIFYTELQRGETVSASLRKAQIKFIEQGKHPYFWSPFAIIGK